MHVADDAKHGGTAAAPPVRLVPTGRSSYVPKGRATLTPVAGHRHAKAPSRISTAAGVVAGTSAAAVALVLGFSQ